MKNLSKTWLMALLAAVFMAGCAGGDGQDSAATGNDTAIIDSGNDTDKNPDTSSNPNTNPNPGTNPSTIPNTNIPSSAYTGRTTQATITQSNAKTLTETGSASIQVSTSGSPVAGGGSGGGAGAKALLRGGNAVALTAASLAPETASGNCGGNAVSDMTADASTGALSGVTTYKAYCQDGTIENGQTSFTGTFHEATSVLELTVTFTNYAVKDSTSDIMMNGTAAMSGTLANDAINNLTMIMNVDVKDNSENMVMKLENVDVAITDAADHTEFSITSGKVYHPDYGYFELSTPTAIRLNAGDVNPSSGVLVITGANNTKGRLTYLSNTEYQVEVDETGGGVYTEVGAYSLPAIAGFAPAAGPVGTQVTLTGANFSTTPADNIVAFNGTATTVISSTATQIVTTVPAGATTGRITVTIAGETAASASDFIVTTGGGGSGSSLVGTWNLTGLTVGGTPIEPLPFTETLTHTATTFVGTSVAPLPFGGYQTCTVNGTYTVSGATFTSTVTSDTCAATNGKTVPYTESCTFSVAGTTATFTCISPTETDVFVYQKQ